MRKIYKELVLIEKRKLYVTILIDYLEYYRKNYIWKK